MRREMRMLAGIGVAALVIGLVWLTIARSYPPGAAARAERASERAIVARAQSAYETLSEFRPLDAIADFDSVLREHLRAPAAALIGRDRADALLADAAMFLQLRIRGNDPAAYVRWRRSLGYEWRSYQSLVDHAIVDAFRVRTGLAWAASDSVERRFAEMWRSSREWKGALNAPRAIGIGPASMGFTRGVIDRLHPSPAVSIADVIPASSPDPTRPLTSVQWLVHPRNRSALLREHEAIEFAVVGAIIEYGDGSRRPLKLTYLWDPRDSRWIHVTLSVHAGSKHEVLGIDY